MARHPVKIHVHLLLDLLGGQGDIGLPRFSSALTKKGSGLTLRFMPALRANACMIWRASIGNGFHALLFPALEHLRAHRVAIGVQPCFGYDRIEVGHVSQQHSWTTVSQRVPS